MADKGKPVGTIFVELDLDASKLDRKQQGILKDATQVTLEIEKNYKNLGIKSDNMFGLMKAQAENAYQGILHSANATANDIVRAEAAKNARIRELNTEMAGTHIGVMSQIRNHYLAVSASIASSIYIIKQAVDVLTMAFAPLIKGFQAVETYRLSTASAAAMVMSFAEKTKEVSMAEMWEKSLKYAQSMVPTLERIAAKTLLSGAETIALYDAFARQGVFLDATNSKQVEGFSRLSNAIPLMTQGQEIMRQIVTEVRSMITGNNIASSVLFQNLRAIDPSLKEHIKLWQQEGTLIEHVGDLLVGFGPASKLLENQWQTVKSSLDTTVTQTLRGGMWGAYNDILGLVKGIDEATQVNKESVQKGLRGAWLAAKGIVESVWSILKGFGPVLETAAGWVMTMVKGWGLLAYAVLPPVAERIGALVEVLAHSANAVVDFAKMGWNALTGDVDAFEAAETSSRINLQKAQASMGKVIAGGIMDEIMRRTEEFTSKINNSVNPEKPPKGAYNDPDALEKAKKAAEEKEKEKRRIEKQLWQEAVKEANEMRAIKEISGSEAITIAQLQLQQEKRNASDIAKAYRSMYKDMKGYNTENYEYRKKSLEEERDAFRDITHDNVTTYKWFADQVHKLDMEMMTSGKDMIDSLKKGWNLALDDMTYKEYTWTRAGAEMFDTFHDSFKSTFSEALFDGAKGKLKSFSDYFNAFADALLKKWMDIIAEMTTRQIMGSGMKQIGGGFSWLTGLLGMGGGEASVIPSPGIGQSIFARGGVISSPVVFPMKRGYGLAGEAGPEGILPLARTSSGDLGVKVAGRKGGGSTIINNNSINISTLDTQTMEQWVKRNSGLMAGAVTKELNDGNKGLKASLNKSVRG